MACTYTIPQGKELRIAISGKSGCGNTTVSTLVAEQLGIPVVNFTFRSLAEEMSLSLKDIIEKAKTDDSFDREVDARQVAYAREQSSVLASRLAIWMLEDADFKVYLKASHGIRACRIYQREQSSLDEITEFTRMRDEEDSRRYKGLYDIDNNDFDFADLIIETDSINAQEVSAIILDALAYRKLVNVSC
ncbi:MAG: cytidylate kinase family protein [Spirochaetaceae bacterium]|jgi:cytidylate kinase|nr:cytidylate kinase family protein [Spirochaetaceae bacterium]